MLCVHTRLCFAQGAIFQNAVLTSTSFTGADVENADFTEVCTVQLTFACRAGQVCWQMLCRKIYAKFGSTWLMHGLWSRGCS